MNRFLSTREKDRVKGGFYSRSKSRHSDNKSIKDAATGSSHPFVVDLFTCSEGNDVPVTNITNNETSDSRAHKGRLGTEDHLRLSSRRWSRDRRDREDRPKRELADQVERVYEKLKIMSPNANISRAEISLVLESQYLTQNTNLCTNNGAYLGSIEPGSMAAEADVFELKAKEDAAVDFCILSAETQGGLLRSPNTQIEMLGAVNVNGTTCYLDALLFAMYARLSNFDIMLQSINIFDVHGSSDSKETGTSSINVDPATTRESKDRLAALLLLWVNLLRSGRLITADITQRIQEQLSRCGWAAATDRRQQDASEAFTFITESLALPLLSLRMDIFHDGKENADDDHRIVKERLLQLAIPTEEPEDGHVITLEECLELYFNAKIEVTRQQDSLERRDTLDQTTSCTTSVSSLDKIPATKIEIDEVIGSPTLEITPSSPIKIHHSTTPDKQQGLPAEVVGFTDLVSEPFEASMGLSPAPKAKIHQARKEIVTPAWQFFSLIPWYMNERPDSNARLAAHFSEVRPILGICLKRYGCTADGEAFKRNTPIDIPLEINLPTFISDDIDIASDDYTSRSFRLCLQSFICHEGVSVDSGHYVSLVRQPVVETETEGGQACDDTWLKFDDLAPHRVTSVNVQEWLTKDNPSPYMLFYQVMPIADAFKEAAPPSYAESTASRNSIGSNSVPISNHDFLSAPHLRPHRPSLDSITHISADTTFVATRNAIPGNQDTSQASLSGGYDHSSMINNMQSVQAERTKSVASEPVSQKGRPFSGIIGSSGGKVAVTYVGSTPPMRETLRKPSASERGRSRLSATFSSLAHLRTPSHARAKAGTEKPTSSESHGVVQQTSIPKITKSEHFLPPPLADADSARPRVTKTGEIVHPSTSRAPTSSQYSQLGQLHEQTSPMRSDISSMRPSVPPTPTLAVGKLRKAPTFSDPPPSYSTRYEVTLNKASVEGGHPQVEPRGQAHKADQQDFVRENQKHMKEKDATEGDQTKKVVLMKRTRERQRMQSRHRSRNLNPATGTIENGDVEDDAAPDRECSIM